VVKSVHKTISMRMYPIIRDGKTVGAYSIFRDVTDLHKLDQEVKRITSVAEEYISQENVKNELEYLQIITKDPGYLKLIQQAITAAQTDATILISGENGSGKEIFTKLIHANSLRKNKPFIAVNCAAIPESLIESELFGCEAGAFTGAKKGGKIGKFQLAQGGTLFLDEVGDTPLMMQTKLLRALQEGEIQKVGSEETISVDVRVIAATNQPLMEMIREKKFREDLYYRLNVLSFKIPPLRERKGDILLLTNQFLQRFNEKYEKSVTLSEKSYEILLDYDWPGNVRELQNCVESCVIMSSGGPVTPETLPATLKTLSGTCEDIPGFQPDPKRHYGTLKEETDQFEQTVIREVLAQHGGDQEAAARHLGISRRTFYRKK
jgi:transcriptional regulator with PAS, ATPase and Fis domain